VFRRGSLGPDLPARDLFVSPEHAMYLDGVLLPARLLVNGTSIRQVSDFDLVEYFHLEFDEPQVILTNGAPSESYVDHDNRRMFENYHDYVAAYGEPESRGRRPRRFYMVTGGAALEAIRRRLTADFEAAA
jgi:hypothetical protein